MQAVVVGAALVAETLAVEVDREEGLATHPEQFAHLVFECLLHVGGADGQCCALEQHAGRLVVFGRPCPQARLDAVALVGDRCALAGVDFGGLGL